MESSIPNSLESIIQTVSYHVNQSVLKTSLFWLVYKEWVSQISYVKVCSSKV